MKKPRDPNKTREYRETNKEKVTASRRRWCQKNMEHRKAYKKRYNQQNPEKVKQFSKNKLLKYPEKNAARVRKYQTSKMCRTPAWLTDLQFDHIRLFYEASSLMTKETGVQFHVDHIVPLRGENVSGLHVPWNLQVLPARENVSKGNR